MKTLFLLFTFFTCNFIYAQVGIGTTEPNASSILDIRSSESGVLFPQVALTSLTDGSIIANGPVNSLLVYNTSTTAPLSPGYYYWFADTWNRLMTENQANMPKFFYMPSIAIPTSTAHFTAGDGFTESEGVFSVSLYNRYAAQFTTPIVSNSVRTTTLPVLAANKLDYYITSYDEAVFEAVTVSNAGVLTYKIRTGAQVTAATFMNIVFAVKP